MGQLTNLYVSESYQGLLKLANSTTGVTGTLQYVQDGLGNNIPMLVSTSSVVITGSFRGDGSGLTGVTAIVDSGSLVTTASFNAYTSSNDNRVNSLIASTGSYATTSSLTSLSQSIASTDLAQNNRLTAIETTTSSLQNQINQKLDTGSFNAYTSSNDAKVNSLIAATASYVTETESGSFLITGSASGNVLTFTKGNGSQFNLTVDTGSNSNRNGLITTGSIGQTQSITGSLNVGGTITATSASFTYVTTVFETASVIYSSGSNQFGDASNDTQTLWGTVNLPSGPLVITGSVTATNFTGSLRGTASYSTNALSASHAINADTASFFNGLIASASYAVNADTASIARDVIVVGKNNNASTLTRGTVVRIVGADGNNPLIDSASFINEELSANVFGMLSEDVATNGFANVVVLGKVTGLNTVNFPAGQLLFLSSSGTYSTASVTPPSQSVRLGQVLRQNVNQGSIYFRADNGYELGELHNVIDTANTTGELLSYVSGSYGLWVNKTSSQLGLATTGSNNFVGNQIITGSVNVSGSLNVNGPVSLLPGTGLSTAPGLLLGGNTSNKLWVSGSNNDVYLRSIADIILTIGTNSNLRISGPGSNAVSASIVGNVDLTGSMNIRNGNFEVISDNTTLNPDFYLTSSQAGQSNMIFGWGDNPGAGGAAASQANYTGSLRITGSNNIVNLPQIRATALGGGADQQGYISGSNNWINSSQAGIFLNTGSLLFPKTQGNILGLNSTIGMNFTTSSLAGGHPIISNNLILGGQGFINSNSGSISAFSNNALLGGGINSTQNFVTNTRPAISANNVIGLVTLNHLSSSINYQSNYNNATLTINNAVSSSGIANNSLTVGNNAFFGSTTSIFASGSQSSNATRNITNNLIGGINNVVSSSFVSSSNSNLVSSLIVGNGLNVFATHTAGTNGGSAFLGRFNDNNFADTQNIVFAVGTGTAVGNRRTGLYVTSGSLVGVSGSFDIKGNSTITGSVNILGETVMSSSLGAATPLYVSGTMQTQRLQFDGNPFNSSPASNLAALRYSSDNQTFQYTNYNKAEITTQSFIDQIVNTGSLSTRTRFGATYAGTTTQIETVNDNGTRRINLNSDATTVTGSINISSVMNLRAQNPLPAGTIGDLAVSSSNQLYFYNGAWTLIV